MKTLKKTLCLVLAVVMVVGVLILPAYAADDYDDATDALQHYGVLQGYPDGKLHTDANITRGQMAAILYRIMTGDVKSTDTQVALKYGNYADHYTDADVAPWAKGYIGYCTNQGVLKGYDTGAIQPNKQISGYEVQAMLLRALGYDKNNEYTGDNWKYNVLADAAKTGINKNVNDISPEKATPRGAVAQYTYDAAFVANRVEPSVYPTVGYKSLDKKLVADAKSETTRDDWGAPSTKYTCTFTYPDVDVEGSNTVANTPVTQAWTPITECDAGYSGAVTIYINGKDNKTTDEIQKTDTVNTIGAYGRWTRIFADGSVVCVDTLLGKVTSAASGSLQDTGNHDVSDGSDAKFNVYYNGEMIGLNRTVPFKDNAKSPLEKVEAESDLKKGTMVTTNAVTKKSQNSITVATDVTLKNITTATVETVTISGIKYSSDTTQAITGFTGTNGKTYYYSITYGYTDNVSEYCDSGKTVLNNTAIGKTFNVYTDGHDNVIGVAQDASTSSYGLVVARKAVPTGNTDKDGNLQYELEYTILNKDNTQTTVKAVNYKKANGTDPASSVPYIQRDIAGTVGVGTLVRIKSNPLQSGYSVLTTKDDDDVTNIVLDGDNGTAFKCSNPLAVKANGTALVNTGTVIYVANYTMDNAKNGYVFTGYTAYTDFRSIPDIGAKSTVIYDADGTKITSGSNTSSLKVTYIAKADSNADADYVLVEYGTQKSTVNPTTVPNYVYVIGDSKVTAGDHYTYGVILNGSKTTMDIANDSATANNLSGLYTYNETTNSTKSVNAGPINTNKDSYGTIHSWSYADGVIKVGTGKAMVVEQRVSTNNLQYITTANDVNVYIVNPTTGELFNTTYTLGQLDDLYGDATIYVEFDQYNLVRTLYIVDNMNQPAKIPSDIANVNNKTTIDSPKYLDWTIEDYLDQFVVPDDAKYSVFGKVEKIVTSGGVEYTECKDSEVFNKNYTYRLTLTFTADSGYAFFGTNYSGKTAVTTGSNLRACTWESKPAEGKYSTTVSLTYRIVPVD